MRVESKLVPVTLIKILPQEIVRHKTIDVDGYAASVVGVGKVETQKEKWQKVKYSYQCEFETDDEFVQSYAAWSALTESVLENAKTLRVISVSKGKGFQGVIKRHNFAGGPATHGSKFHRVWGSTGNRKPRRTHKGHPMAGRMGNDRITLKRVPVVAQRHDGADALVALKGSIPGGYNSYIQLQIV